MVAGRRRRWTRSEQADLDLSPLLTDAAGTVTVQLEDFDTDQITIEETVAVEHVLAPGWEIDRH